MAIYAISDLHLSSGSKPMDIFGEVWADHADTIRKNWDDLVSDSDTVLLPGDLSWAMRLSEAIPDLQFIAERPGRKMLIRGNHDYWWQRRSTTRIEHQVGRNMAFLQGTVAMVGEIAVTGTRGWRLDWESRPDIAAGNSDRVFRRELDYLERGLLALPESARVKVAMLHFPPFDEELRPNAFAEMLAEHSVDILVYGHVHLGLGNWLEGDVLGVQYHIASADLIGFRPKLILPSGD